jgi:type IV secretory pathway VirB6-like protein
MGVLKQGLVFALTGLTCVSTGHHPEFPYGEVFHFFGLFLVAEMMLRYYNVPLPMIGSSVHQVLPEIGRQLSSNIDLASLDTLLAHIAAIATGTERPSIFNPLELFVFASIMVDMIAIEGILFGVTILGFVAVGIGSLLGPLFIPFLVVPRLNWLFWNWLSFMLQYSFYQVVASALVFVWTNVLVNFIDRSIHGDYTLAHFFVLLIPLGMLNIGLAFSVFRITSFVSDLFKGAAAAGGNLTGSVATVVKGAFA